MVATSTRRTRQGEEKESKRREKDIARAKLEAKLVNGVSLSIGLVIMAVGIAVGSFFAQAGNEVVAVVTFALAILAGLYFMLAAFGV
jgi:hypothetical protein